MKSVHFEGRNEQISSEESVVSYPWQAIVDPATLQTYYYNIVSEVTQWEIPKDFVDVSEAVDEEDTNANIHHVDDVVWERSLERMIDSLGIVAENLMGEDREVKQATESSIIQVEMKQI